MGLSPPPGCPDKSGASHRQDDGPEHPAPPPHGACAPTSESRHELGTILDAPLEVLAATDFFTVEVATWHGLVTYDVLVVMELATRRVQIAGITPHPAAAFMQQCARQLTDSFDGFLLGKRYLLHDRDTKFTRAFDELLKGSGVEPIVLPARSPNLNAHCERFVRSIKEEALRSDTPAERAVAVLCDPAISGALSCRAQSSRPRQSADCTVPDFGSHGDSQATRTPGGLLSYYYRDAA